MIVAQRILNRLNLPQPTLSLVTTGDLSEQFLSLMTRHYPAWREAREELNELPLTAEAWNE